MTSVLMLGLLCRRSTRQKLAAVPPHIYVAAALLLWLTQRSYVRAFQLAPPEQVDLINYLWPLFVMLSTCLDGDFRQRVAYIAAAGIGLLGLCILLDPMQSADTWSVDFVQGYAWAFVAAVSWTCFTLFCRRQNRLPSEILPVLCTITGSLFGLEHWLMGKPWVTLSGLHLGIICAMGWGTNGISYLLWQYALLHGQIRRLALTSFFTPVLSVTWLVLVGKSSASGRLALATLCISFAAVLPSLLREFQRMIPARAR
jgi:drug/metabolite transporter (DMT)-like permease